LYEFFPLLFNLLISLLTFDFLFIVINFNFFHNELNIWIIRVFRHSQIFGLSRAIEFATSFKTLLQLSISKTDVSNQTQKSLNICEGKLWWMHKIRNIFCWFALMGRKESRRNTVLVVYGILIYQYMTWRRKAIFDWRKLLKRVKISNLGSRFMYFLILKKREHETLPIFIWAFFLLNWSKVIYLSYWGKRLAKLSWF